MIVCIFHSHKILHNFHGLLNWIHDDEWVLGQVASILSYSEPNKQEKKHLIENIRNTKSLFRIYMY